MITHTHKIPKLPNRVVVFGSKGFVGKKLIHDLKINQIPYFEFPRSNCELEDIKSVDIITSEIQPTDSVVFLSAITPDRGKGIEEFIRNIEIAKNVSRAFETLEVNQFILFSSESIYPPTKELLSERTSLSPTDIYGLMHLTRERIFESLNLPLLIIRPTLIYGQGDTHNSYGPNRFLKEAKEKGTITLFGEGEEKRSHIHVDDVVEVLKKAFELRSIGSINLCPNPTISFMDIAKEIKEGLKGNIQIITRPRSSEATHRYFDDFNLVSAFPNQMFKHRFVI